jgi:flagellar basal-body rod modification protein FlgD
MSTSINPAAQTPAAGPTPTQTSGAGNAISDPLANEATFLTLLVSQLQNQDPLNPTDSNQFVSQLTAYSQLEQLIGIHQNTTTLAGVDPTSSSSDINTSKTGK